jgi:hypothetical protein
MERSDRPRQTERDLHPHSIRQIVVAVEALAGDAIQDQRASAVVEADQRVRPHDVGVPDAAECAVLGQQRGVALGGGRDLERQWAARPRVSPRIDRGPRADAQRLAEAEQSAGHGLGQTRSSVLNGQRHEDGTT